MRKSIFLLSLAFAASALAVELEPVPLTDGVWVAIQPEERWFNDSNSVIVELDGGLLVVDSQSLPVDVGKTADAIEALDLGPVRWLLTTHFHGDHTQGHQVYRERFGDELEILGHVSLNEDIPGKAREMLDERIDGLVAALSGARDELAARRSSDGEALVGEKAASYAERVGRSQRYLEEIQSIEFLVPDRSYEADLELGSARVFSFEAHTRGDSVLWLPDQRVLVTGDLLDAAPWAGHGRIASWLECLDVLEDLDPKWIVPGHGPVFEGTDQLVLVRELIERAWEGALSAHDAGNDLETFRSSADFSDLEERFVRGSQTTRRNFTGFLPDLLEQAWLQSQPQSDSGD